MQSEFCRERRNNRILILLLIDYFYGKFHYWVNLGSYEDYK